MSLSQSITAGQPLVAIVLQVLTLLGVWRREVTPVHVERLEPEECECEDFITATARLQIQIFIACQVAVLGFLLVLVCLCRPQKKQVELVQRVIRSSLAADGAREASIRQVSRA
eukprot:6478655-Amphidinium_carterae.2